MSSGKIKMGDLYPALQLTLVSDGSPVTGLGDATAITLHLQTPDGVVHDRSVALSDQTLYPGQITYQWVAADTAAVGNVELEVEITWPTNEPQTIPNNGTARVQVVATL